MISVTDLPQLFCTAAMLPYLRAYMGHEKFSDTAYYIHILPERLMVSPGVQWDNIDCIGMGVDIWEH